MNYARFSLIMIFCSCLLFLATSCKKQGIYLLPPATNNGSNTFGCLINGKAFLGQSRSELFLSIAAVQGSYHDGTLSVLGSHYFGSTPTGSIFGISIDVQTPKHSGIITVPGANRNIISYSDNQDTFRFNSDSTHTGSVIITRFDSITHIYSGTFQGSLIDTYGKIVLITDGRFDVKGQ